MPDPTPSAEIAAMGEVTRRWLHDAEFHAKVEEFVSMVLVRRPAASTRTLLREAVALTLVLEDYERATQGSGSATTAVYERPVTPDENRRDRRMTPYETEQMTLYGPCESCGGPRTARITVDPGPDEGRPQDGRTINMGMACLWCGTEHEEKP